MPYGVVLRRFLKFLNLYIKCKYVDIKIQYLIK